MNHELVLPRQLTLFLILAFLLKTFCIHVPWIFISIKCSKLQTYCESNPCVSNSTCQEGFGAEGYRCVCPEGYYGDKCQLGK